MLPRLPRPAILPSSLGSKEEEEEDKCEKAALRSVGVEIGAELAAETGVCGCGLRSPVRLSNGTGVMVGVTSLGLT